MSSPIATRKATTSSRSASATERKGTANTVGPGSGSQTPASPRRRSPQGFLAALQPSPAALERLFKVWPTYWWAGIRVRHIARDWTGAEVELRLGLLNRNFFGTAFGGSLYAMTDPFFALLMLGQLGREYVVWDQSAHITFIKPGKGVLRASFALPVAAVDAVRSAAADGSRVSPTYTVEVQDRAGEVVARVDKTLYVRRVQPAPGQPEG